ncbi:MAG: SbcC/MukB-like Walker B domain-containing protein, partial [Christensenellaceae bacterium]
LSGGEKFLVALALSLGLSAVVQAQSGGIKLDAMFIDEGFGSLDPDEIKNALELLSNVKGGSKLVGIISHVQLLKENIQTSIEIRKAKSGSEIVMNA